MAASHWQIDAGIDQDEMDSIDDYSLPRKNNITEFGALWDLLW